MSTINLADLYSEMEETITASSVKEYGKYLPFTWYRNEVVEIANFLCEKHGSVPTTVLRKVIVAYLEKKIESMPEGGSKVFDQVGRVREEVTVSELKERLSLRLQAATKSSNNGPTITRALCSPANKEWLRKKGIVYENGSWSITAQHEEDSS